MYLDDLPRAWRYRGDICHGHDELSGEIISSSTSGRNLAVHLSGYSRLSGPLAMVGEVGLIQPENEKPELVRREVSKNGIEYLAEL